MATKQGKQIDKVMDESMPIWLGLIAVLGVFVLMRLFKQESDLQLATQQIPSEEKPNNAYEELG